MAVSKRAALSSKDAHKKGQTNVRLSDVGRAALEALAERDGTDRSAVVERLVRDRARKEGLRIEGLTK